jgi:hypothetical protein
LISSKAFIDCGTDKNTAHRQVLYMPIQTSQPPKGVATALCTKLGGVQYNGLFLDGLMTKIIQNWAKLLFVPKNFEQA